MVPGEAPCQLLMCAAERRSSLPPVRASQAASSEGRRSILSDTRVRKHGTPVQRASPGSPDVGTDWQRWRIWLEAVAS
eukprot:850888-Rhodomonas_salina.2